MCWSLKHQAKKRGGKYSLRPRDMMSPYIVVRLHHLLFIVAKVVKPDLWRLRYCALKLVCLLPYRSYRTEKSFRQPSRPSWGVSLSITNAWTCDLRRGQQQKIMVRAIVSRAVFSLGGPSPLCRPAVSHRTQRRFNHMKPASLITLHELPSRIVYENLSRLPSMER